MTDELVVVIGQQVAGRITRARGRLELHYDDDYRHDPAATPLSVSLPLAEPRHPHAMVGAWLTGLLPDDDGVLRRWGRMFGVSPTSPFSLLATPIGEECAGDARFITADRVDDMLTGVGDVTWLTEAQVARRLRDLRKDSTTWLGMEFTGRFSLAGTQAKTALYNDATSDRWGVPTCAAATSHILKPATVGLDEHDLNEHLCLRAAAHVGLTCARTQILTFEDQSAVASTRYDRIADGGTWLRRIHQEDLCQALGLPPSNKYQNEGGPRTRDICSALRRVVPADQAINDVWRFFDAVTFNWLVGGTDAHAKNYALLLAGRQVRLAPLYDIASALPYPALPRQKLRLAMKYGGYYSLMPRRSAMWPKVAAEFGLPIDAVRDRAGTLMAAVPDAFRDAAAAADVTSLASTLPGRLVDAVAERVADCRDTLTHY